MGRNQRSNQRKAAKLKEQSIQGISSGPKWYSMNVNTSTTKDPTIQLDLRLLHLRNAINPKQHYKKTGKKLPTIFQVGSIIDNPVDYYSTAMTKRERNKPLADALLEDHHIRNYYKKKYNDLQTQNANPHKLLNTRSRKKRKRLLGRK